MGGGASTIMMSNNLRDTDNDGDAQRSKVDRRSRRQRIFEKGDEHPGLNVDTLLHGDYIDEGTRKNLLDALSGFYFLSGGKKDPKMDLLLRAMQKEEFDEGYLLINEGEPGSKLYIVDSGILEVTINGELKREMGKGSMLGELALLYDAPRSASVRCKTRCQLWSLKREAFKQIQAVSACAMQMQRARWLINAPDLAVLSAIDLSRLVCTLYAITFVPGETLYQCNDVTTKICLIEKGSAKVYSPIDMIGNGLTKEEIDKKLGIIRPPTAAPTTVPVVSPSTLGSAMVPASPFAMRRALSRTSSTTFGGPSSAGYFVCSVGEGCVIGMESLRSRAGLRNAWTWQKAKDGARAGAICPFTITAVGEVNCGTFSVEVFENLFENVFYGQEAGKECVDEKIVVMRKRSRHGGKETSFDSTKFRLKYVLGSGSFGVVTYAEYSDLSTGKLTHYALKSLSKAAVVETGQLRHVMDERKLLACMNSRFVLKLYGTYQTPHQLVMVTEPLMCGDLWNVIYETMPFKENDGLTVSLAAFYTASLVLALSHIHKRGIIFRDLKPENVMLDSVGYLRVIDFGFAKRVPYTSTDVTTGETKVHAKTFTLCGTPEYLSPELIFNLGHDQSSDLWALGVLVYEMLMASTPFVPKKADNVTELFTNIAMVTKSGLNLSTRLDKKAGTPHVRSIITQLLKPEPAERIGVQEGSTKRILDHKFFNELDLHKLKDGTIVPEFHPSPVSVYDKISTLKSVKTFSGDQRQFKGF